jgi:hypothetical protein
MGGGWIDTYRRAWPRSIHYAAFEHIGRRADRRGDGTLNPVYVNCHAHDASVIEILTAAKLAVKWQKMSSLKKRVLSNSALKKS